VECRKLALIKWTVKLVAEAQPGNVVEQEVITIEREDTINPATAGLTIPLSAETSVNTVRNRTMKVGKRLQKSAEVLANCSVSSSCEETRCGSGWRLRPGSTPTTGTEL
jgi:hypothetical protein